MNNRKKLYADTFKRAMVFGAPTIDDLSNRTYLTQHQEEYDNNGNQKARYLALAETADSDMSSFFTLETADAKLNLRQVTVKEKENYKAYLVEQEWNARGICIVLIDEEDNGEAYCNIRYLPYSTLKDIFFKEMSGQIIVRLPKVNIIKLNVTLKLSNTGEVLYRTNKTEIYLENVTDNDCVKLQQQLEFEGAQEIAHFVGQIFEITPSDRLRLAVKPRMSKEQWLTIAFICNCIALIGSAYVSWANKPNFFWKLAPSLLSFAGAGLRSGGALGWFKSPNGPVKIGTYYQMKVAGQETKLVKFSEATSAVHPSPTQIISQ
ncbi:MAG: hypothetical protein AB8E82_04030 [Aureispira sp.]